MVPGTWVHDTLCARHHPLSIIIDSKLHVCSNVCIAKILPVSVVTVRPYRLKKLPSFLPILHFDNCCKWIRQVVDPYFQLWFADFSAS